MKAPVGLLSGRAVCVSRWRGFAPTSSAGHSKRIFTKRVVKKNGIYHITERTTAMSFHAKDFAGSHCGCRYQQDYRPTLGRDGKKESGTLEVIKFYYDGAIRFEQHCYGEAATFVFGVWASGMDADGTLHWVLPDRRKSYYDEAYLPKKLDRVDEDGNLYFDGSVFPWKLADDFAEDKRWGYPKWKVMLGKLTGKGKK